jgi:hypothetical protein
MLKKFKKLSIIVASLLMLAAPTLAPAVAYGSLRDELCDGVDAATGDTECDTPTSAETPLTRVITLVINIFSLIVGAASVIMIIYGGFKYITSGGSDSNVSGAKNTIMYAVIGLIIVALAQIIVRFVLSQTDAATAPE